MKPALGLTHPGRLTEPARQALVHQLEEWDGQRPLILEEGMTVRVIRRTIDEVLDLVLVLLGLIAGMLLVVVVILARILQAVSA